MKVSTRVQRLFQPVSNLIHFRASLCSGVFQYTSKKTSDHADPQLFPKNTTIRRCYCSVAPSNTHEKHSGVYEKILKAARKGLQKRYKDRKNDIVDLIDSLLALNVSKYDITWLLAETPELLSNCQDFHDQASWLVEQGFVGTELANLLHKDPSVVRLSKKKSLIALKNFALLDTVKASSRGLLPNIRSYCTCLHRGYPPERMS